MPTIALDISSGNQNKAVKSLAIVGSGIAGLGCAYFLSPHFDITLLEKDDYSGGHTNTIEVPDGAGGAVSFDTGFMVYNLQTYPLLTKLFAELGLATKKTDMTFSVQYLPDGIEWNGAGFNKIFAQRKNIVNPRFWRMLRQLDWFNKNAYLQINDPSDGQILDLTVSDYVRKFGLGEDFLNWYMVPMGGAVWSTPPDKMRDFPVASLIRFFHNHGFLGMDTHFQWYTVVGGASSYVPLITAGYRDRIRHNAAVKSVRIIGEQVEVTTVDGAGQLFDKVIFACHADQALALLADPTALQRELLTPFKYQSNDITVHSDPSVMPSTRLAWASWNYRVAHRSHSTVHYWMNSLQGVSDTMDYFVSLNSADSIEPSKIHRQMQYTHPLFDLATMAAQSRLHQLNGTGGGDNRIYFCGSYFKYGFHEDAFRSAVELASTILGRSVF